MGEFIDLTGQKFGRLTVIKKGRIDITKSGHKIQRWICKCDCGNTEEIIGNNLRKGVAIKCKECQKPNLVGQRFNHFLVLSRSEDKIRKNGKHIVQWKCQCDCGNIRYLSTTELKSNKCKSCGCMHDYYSRINNTQHGDSHQRLYNIWLGMKARCFNEKDYHYKWYGGRGISMDKQWVNNYKSFKEWALSNGYNDKLTIDRINPNGNYEPLNCRWVDMKVQSNNRRNNRKIKAFGLELTLGQWSRITGLPSSTIRRRIDSNKYSPDNALSTPTRKNQDGHYYYDEKDRNNILNNIIKYKKEFEEYKKR